jgi:hypothetical protein
MTHCVIIIEIPIPLQIGLILNIVTIPPFILAPKQI